MSTFDFTPLLTTNLPPAAGKWSGYPDVNFVGGHNAREAIPIEALIEGVTRRLREVGGNLATYHIGDGPQGYVPLREFMAHKMTHDRGAPTTAEQVLITSGSLQGLDLVNALLVDRGDAVIIEESSYGGMFGKLARRGADIIGAPLDGDGLRLDALERILDDLAARGQRAKYVFTIPTVQNPTGSVMPIERREALLRLTRAHGVPIFEDECYADLVWSGDRPPALRGMDDTGSVIHIGSFSKNLAPALRLGYLVADWPVMSRILPLKGDAGTNVLSQMVVAEYFGQHYEAHIAGLLPRLKSKAAAMVETVEREFGTAAEFSAPKGGIFLWIRIPGVDTSQLFQTASAEGVHFNAGAEWSWAGADAGDCMRLCFALPSEDEIRDGVARLADICRRENGIPARSGNISHNQA
ncbi:MAG: PLP-dependent aminotransferase family protein [Paracoccaceae bacterium]